MRAGCQKLRGKASVVIPLRALVLALGAWAGGVLPAIVAATELATPGGPVAPGLPDAGGTAPAAGNVGDAALEASSLPPMTVTAPPSTVPALVMPLPGEPLPPLPQAAAGAVTETFVAPLAAPADAPLAPLQLPVETEAGQLLFPDMLSPEEEFRPGMPPPLLSPHTRPSPRPRPRPLLLTPILSARELVPRAGAGNCVRRDERGRFMGWMDHQQCVFSGRALVTARWIDDFFGDWHDDEATMMARLVAHTVVTESEGYENKLTLRASATLPNARRRLRLIITDETDDDATGQDLRRQLGQDDSRLSAALRWMSMEQDGLDSNLDVGARGINPTDLFVRYRLRKIWNLTDESIARLSQTLRYGSDSKERYTPVLDLERALDNRSVLRLSNYYDYRYESASEGFNWSHGASFSRALHNSRSFSYGFSLNGQTRPEWRGESYGPWLIYRSPFLRPWLYYEVEPHYTWYRERDWEGLVSLLVRVEMQFGWRN